MHRQFLGTCNKGDKDGEEARKAKQDLVAELVSSKAVNQARDRLQQRKGQQARRQQASPRKPSATAPRTSRLPRPVKRKQGDGRTIPGGGKDTETPQQMANTEA